MSHLDKLEQESIFIIREAISRFENPAALWSTGKDSGTSLHLIRKASITGKIEIPVIHIDTQNHFSELLEFRDRIAEEWDLDLRIARNEDAIASGVSPQTTSRFSCCTTLKTQALRQMIEKEHFDAIFVAIRWDESAIRSKERYMSPRDRAFRWRVSKPSTSPESDSGLEALQDMELSGWGLFETDFGPDAHHVRIHPILHFSELEIWEYVKRENLPINPLYFCREGCRLRSLGCAPCTMPIKSSAKTVDDIIDEVRKSWGQERAGRAQDKERAFQMERLRALGYMND